VDAVAVTDITVADIGPMAALHRRHPYRFGYIIDILRVMSIYPDSWRKTGTAMAVMIT
jgi:hypothetical protein